MDFDRLAKLGLPGTGYSISGHSCPNCSWSDYGVRILTKSGNVGIVNHGRPDDVRKARFTSFTYTQFHYCPSGGWEEWVELAQRILAVDGAMNASVTTS